MNLISDFFCSNDNMVTRMVKQFAFKYVMLSTKIAPYRYGLNEKPRDQKIIVSMTSYPKRFKSIIMPLKSLLRQTLRPDRIIVWLGSDSDASMLTEQMLQLKQYGVEYRFDNELNLKPHKKYYYALQEYPDDLVITVDDDIVYPRGLIKSLYRMHILHPDLVCARRVHRLKYADGKRLPYREWDFECRKERKPSFDLMATNGAGTLFPPNALPQRAFNSSEIMSNCLNADDVWLWFMEKMNGVSTIWVPCLLVHPPVVKESRDTGGLADTNVEMNGNDFYMSLLDEKYK